MVLEKSPGRPEEARPDSPPEGEERVDGGKREKEEEAPRTVVRDVPGKGKGLFAARDLRMGEVVMRESPLIVMPDAVFQLEDMDRLESWLDKRVNALSSSDRAAFSALSDCRSPPDEDGEVEKTSLGIFFTNDMTFDGDAALFVHMARANHSCAPNADFVTRTRLGKELFRVGSGWFVLHFSSLASYHFFFVSRRARLGGHSRHHCWPGDHHQLPPSRRGGVRRQGGQAGVHKRVVWVQVLLQGLHAAGRV